jgi:hypothetical protein
MARIESGDVNRAMSAFRTMAVFELFRSKTETLSEMIDLWLCQLCCSEHHLLPSRSAYPRACLAERGVTSLREQEREATMTGRL